MWFLRRLMPLTVGGLRSVVRHARWAGAARVRRPAGHGHHDEVLALLRG